MKTEGYITDKTFNEKEGTNYIKIEPIDNYFKWERVGDDIVFTTNFIAAPRIAYSISGNEFIFDFAQKQITKFVSDHFDGDIFYPEPTRNFISKYATDDYRIKHISFIENWSKVVVHKDGTFEKTDYPLVPFSVPLEDSYELFHQLFVKYRKGTIKLLDEGKFIPTITGGCDTRTLIGLYRDLIKKYNINTFFSLNSKNEKQTQAEYGRRMNTVEKEIGMKVAKTVGLDFYVTAKPKGVITLAGKFAAGENVLFTSPNSYNLELHPDINNNNPDFIYKYVQHSKRGTQEMRPYADDLWFQIKQPKEVFIIKALLMMIFVPDLLDIECYTHPVYTQSDILMKYKFHEMYAKCIPEAKRIMELWGEEKCKNIFKE